MPVDKDYIKGKKLRRGNRVEIIFDNGKKVLAYYDFLSKLDVLEDGSYRKCDSIVYSIPHYFGNHGEGTRAANVDLRKIKDVIKLVRQR